MVCSMKGGRRRRRRTIRRRGSSSSSSGSPNKSLLGSFNSYGNSLFRSARKVRRRTLGWH